MDARRPVCRAAVSGVACWADFWGPASSVSLIGLILQIGLLYLLFRFVMGFFASRRPSMSGMSRSGFGTLPGGASVYGNSDVGRTQGRPLQLRTEDYQTFEQRLTECQEAYSQGDLATLRRIATPEMVRNFERELADYERRGLVNRLSDVRMTQGDLSEAWNENGIDYATVAMRFSIVDTTIERSSGRVVAGDVRVPQNVTEVWTFLRPAGAGASGWTLSAIQQA
jgi:predicted lipid-binding transport protein (Tim44 family)